MENKSFRYFCKQEANVANKRVSIPSKPENASGSMVSMLLPSSSREFSNVKCENTLDGTSFNLLWANPSESRFFRPEKCVEVTNLNHNFN